MLLWGESKLAEMVCSDSHPMQRKEAPLTLRSRIALCTRMLGTSLVTGYSVWYARVSFTMKTLAAQGLHWSDAMVSSYEATLWLHYCCITVMQ